MATVLTNAHIYTGEGEIEEGYIRFTSSILGVGKMEAFKEEDGDDVKDLEGKLVIPGFIDVHSHGGYGVDNMDGDADKINTMISRMLEEGITSYFPTTMTQSGFSQSF